MPGWFQQQWASAADLPIMLDRAAALVRRRALQRAIKRGADIVVGLVLIGVLLPLLVVVAISVAMDSPGRILFVQRRIGRGGRPFPLLKFRTMVADGDAAFAERIASNRQLLEEWERSRKIQNDPRVTRVGRFLRRHSIDEVPQLINVVRGDMSLVGPRPVVDGEVAYLGALFSPILTVRPGLTGLWAVSGRSNVSYQERAELEYRYVRDWSLWMDLKIMVRTLPVVLHGHGAY